MHAPQSESSILRSLLEKTTSQKTHLEEKVSNLLGELDVECDVSPNRAWTETYYCALHGTHFQDKKETYICPVGSFAQKLRKRYE